MSRRAQLLNPLNPVARYTTARQLYYARRYEEAIEQARAALDMNPNYEQAYAFLGMISEVQGLFDEAVAARQKELTLLGSSEEEVRGLADAYTTLGEEGYWRWKLDYYKEKEKREYVPPNTIAVIYGQLGEKDQAFEWLEKAYEARAGIIVYLNVAAYWDPLRDDPRFQDLLLRMNLEP